MRLSHHSSHQNLFCSSATCPYNASILPAVIQPVKIFRKKSVASQEVSLKDIACLLCISGLKSRAPTPLLTKSSAAGSARVNMLAMAVEPLGLAGNPSRLLKRHTGPGRI